MSTLGRSCKYLVLVLGLTIAPLGGDIVTAQGSSSHSSQGSPSYAATSSQAFRGEASPAVHIVHIIRPGETLWRISRQHGVSIKEIARANGIVNVSLIRAGARLIIPFIRGQTQASERQRPLASRGSANEGRGVAQKVRLRWPVAGQITSPFGRRWGALHEGIDIATRTGTPFVAAASGRVTFVGWRSGYGRLIIIQHEGGLETYYAHNSRIVVSVGEWVEAGDYIGRIGNTGRSTGPHLHFEVRTNGRPVDPLGWLP